MYSNTHRLFTLALAISATLLMGACSSTPERIDVLDDARATISDVSNHPDAHRVAGDEIEAATQSLKNAEYLQHNNGDYEDVYHHAYLALRHAEVAQERIAEAHTREQIERSEAERTRILLAAREAETDRALARAEYREREAELARSVAQVREHEAQQARELAEERAAAAALAEQRADSAIAEQQRLHAMLEDLEAEKTERGYVLTLGDILFDTDKSELKPGASRTMDRLAEFLQEYPDRRLLIEGHADARGTDAYNDSLSQSRANAVRLALIDRGIQPGRLDAEGMGEDYPLASNDTVAGRQENRRVEIVVSDAEGSFPAAAIRTASRF